MSEPFEAKPITTLIHNQFPELDEAISVDIRTVTPSRTFLEKAFLLNEEFQKEKPRSRRMSRHLYDLEKLMDTNYGKAALEDTALYQAIVDSKGIYLPHKERCQEEQKVQLVETIIEK